MSLPEATKRSALERLAGAVIRHRRRVMLIWLVLFIAGGAAASQLTSRLSYDFSLPGQPAYQTGEKILHLYGNGGTVSPGVLVVTVPQGQNVQSDGAAIAAAFAGAHQANPEVRFVDVANTRDPRFVTSNGQTTFAYLFVPPSSGFGPDKPIAAAQHSVEAALPGYRVGLTGIVALGSGGSTKGPSVLIETLVAGVGALAVLAFVFASFMALVPLLIAAVSILTTFLVLLGLSYLTPVSFIVQFLVSLVGLGVAIDYSLLLVTRWREERAHGADNATAVVTAVETAGRTVALSGLTVAIGLVALVVLPVPAMRSTGIGGMLIPLVSILVVNTLLPALLAGVGPRIDWPRIRHEDHASRFWSRWAAAVARRRWWATAGALAILVICIIPVFGLK